MFIRWNPGCQNIYPFNDCNSYEEVDYLPVVPGETYVMKDESVTGNIELVNAKTGSVVGLVNAPVPPVNEPSLRIRISDVKLNSIARVSTTVNCEKNCGFAIYRTAYANDAAFINAIGNEIAAGFGSSSVSGGVISVTFNGTNARCKSIFTANTNFTNVGGNCSRPNIITDCVMPIIRQSQSGWCGASEECVQMVQLQGFNMCITILSQPQCINTEGYFAFRIPEGLPLGGCYFLRNNGRCSQTLVVSCDGCYNALIRARNKNEPYTQIRLPIELHSKRVISGGEVSKNEALRIRRVYGAQETGYTLTTDYLLPDVHFALASLAQKDTFQIFRQYEAFANPRWEGFVLNGEYEIKYTQAQPRLLLAQGEMNLLVNKFTYNNLPC